MKIYTKTGDGGETAVFGGPKLRKDDPRIEAYGTVDETNATLGMARAAALPTDLDACLERIQHELFAVGGELATPNPSQHGMDLVGDDHIERLEREIDAFEQELPPLTQFILPAGQAAAAALHLARTVCRNAERRVVTMTHADEHPVSPRIVKYLNRLSDLLFVLGRVVNQRAGVGDVAWRKPPASRGE